MHPFRYVRAADPAAAATAAAAPDASFVAGGTTLVDLMRLEVMRPTSVVDITGLSLDQIADVAGGGLRIGAMVRNSALAEDARVAKSFPVLAQALLSGASPQLRNMATTGGNLLQRTRCPYFRDIGVAACNKRVPGTGCAAKGGVTRSHAVLGTSDACIASNPSDMNVALIALDAQVHVRGATGTERTIAMGDLHTLPGAHPEVEHTLAPGELIVAVTVPPTKLDHQIYVKVRDRASFAFALASAAVALQLEGAKGKETVKDVRIALGGVATKPWRAQDAEAALRGKPLSAESIAAAGTAAMTGARAWGENAFKIELGSRTVMRALKRLGGLS